MYIEAMCSDTGLSSSEHFQKLFISGLLYIILRENQCTSVISPRPSESRVSVENLTNFDCGNGDFDPSSVRVCDCNGSIFDILRRNLEGMKLRRLDWKVETEVEVKVDIDVSDGESGAVEHEGDWRDGECDFFRADFAGGGGIALELCQRAQSLSRTIFIEGGVSSDQRRGGADLMGLRCGVRDRCRPIAICSTVGSEAASST